jgi:hypothetical protein
MAKSKKKEPPVPKKKERTYTMPVEHLDRIADRIVTTRPTKVIVLNTIKDIWLDGRNYGHFRRIREAKDFRDKREATIKQIFDSLQDMVDDKIHARSNNENKS